MKSYKDIVASNLAFLRKKNKYTQGELAEKINYSDNAISRWERGEVVPGIDTLEKFCDFYQITMNQMLDEKLPEETSKYTKEQKEQAVNKVFIILLSVSAVWFLAIILFIYGLTLLDQNFWTIFVFAVPVSCIVALVYNNMWGNKVANFVLQSVLIWSLIASIYLYLLEYNLWLLFLLGIPTQVASVAWFVMKPVKIQRKPKL